MILAALDDTPYRIVLILHILAAIAGFGAVFLNGAYLSKARSLGGLAGAGATRVNFEVSELGLKIIYLVPILGLALVGMSSKEFTFEQAWVSVSLLLYIVAVVAARVVVVPAHKQTAELQEELGALPAGDASAPGKVAQLDALGTRLAVVGGSLNLVTVVILVLMVVKPGA